MTEQSWRYSVFFLSSTNPMSHSHTHHPAAIHNSLMHQMCNAVVENTPPTHQYHLDSLDFSCCTHSSLSYCLKDPLPNLEFKWSTKSTGAVVLKKSIQKLI